MKATIARDVTLAYPDYSQEFKIYTDGSKRQLGAVITQNKRQIAFFSRKHSACQQKYSVTEIELLAIGETLKVFRPEASSLHRSQKSDARHSGVDL